MNSNDIVAGDLLVLDNYRLALVLSTEPEDPFFDYGLDVYISLLNSGEPFWIASKRLKPLSSDLLP